MQPGEYISVREAALRLGCGVGTLRARIKRGKLEVHNIVGRQAITVDQLKSLQNDPPRKRKKKPSHNSK